MEALKQMPQKTKYTNRAEHRFLLDSEQLTILIYMSFVVVKIFAVTQMSLLPFWSIFEKLADYSFFALGLLLIVRKTSVNNKWFIILIILAFIGAMSAVYNKRLMTTATIVIFIINSMNIKSLKVLRWYCIVASVVVSIVIFLNIIGVFYTDYRIGNRGTTRYYLGFLSATHSANYFLHIVLAYVGQKRTKIRFDEAVIILSLNYIFYKLTDTRAVFLLVIMIVFALFLYRVKPSIVRSKLSKVMMMSFMPVFAALSLILPLLYSPSNPFMSRLNNLLSYRLGLSKTAVEKYGISLFGNHVVWSTGRLGKERFGEYLYVDSAYMNILLAFGILVFAFIIISFMKMTYKAINSKKFYMAISLSVLAIHSFTDPQLIDLKYDPYLLLFFWAYIDTISKYKNYYLIRRKKGKPVIVISEKGIKNEKGLHSNIL